VVVVEAALYVGTALLISLVPLVVTTAGESLFYVRAGMPLVVRPGVGPVLLVALLSFLALRRSGCLGSLPAQRQLDGFRMRVAGGGGKLLLRLVLGIALTLLHAEQRQQQDEQQQDAHFQRGEAAHGLGRMQWRR